MGGTPGTVKSRYETLVWTLLQKNLRSIRILLKSEMGLQLNSDKWEFYERPETNQIIGDVDLCDGVAAFGDV